MESVDRLSRGLGYFSLALGTVQMAAPGRVNRLIGVRDDAGARRWQRLVGVQELSAAAGILPQRRPVGWLWARTGADVMHLTMLGGAYRARRESAARLGFAIASVVGCFAADGFASLQMTKQRRPEKEGSQMKGVATITIRASRDEVLQSWRAFERYAEVESRLGPVEILEAGPASVRWRTGGAASETAEGTTTFDDAPAGRGTEVHVSVEFDVAGGAVGEAVKKVTGDEPLQLVRDDLRRLKQLVETGEIARSEGAPSGSSAKQQPKQRPAQPLEHVHG